ncbi:MAG: VCBS repeat-containing protein [Deltaproteobacteria bacterium]|nr:VCBS repeat-containing protein [Deltaproteobacteria bacterium]
MAENTTATRGSEGGSTPRNQHPARICGAVLLWLWAAACGGGPSGLDLANEQGDTNVPRLTPIASTNLTPSVTPPVSNDTPLTAAALREQWLSPDQYSGVVVVQFADGTDVRLHAGEWRTAQGAALAGFASFRSQFPDVAIAPALDFDDTMWARIEARAQREGLTLHDWRRTFVVWVADPGRAKQLLTWLEGQAQVERAEPVPKRRPAGVSTPDLTSGQSYISNNPGGLNIVAAWQQGVTGKNQTIIDYEDLWNYDHEDLPVDIQNTPLSSNTGVSGNHGTAVLGIIAAKDNSLGAAGIATTANIRTLSDEGESTEDPFAGLHYFLQQYSLGFSVGGQVLVDEAAGMGPLEFISTAVGSVKDLIELGTVVVSTAGNASLNIDPYLIDDLGTILVGASEGPSLKKAAFSNCGKRVNVFAWGAGVVTTGYGDYGFSELARVDGYGFCIPWEWTQPENAGLLAQVCPIVPSFCQGQGEIKVTKDFYCPAAYTMIPSAGVQTGYQGNHFWYDDDPATLELTGENLTDPNKWYTNHFGGTSAATAIIGGVAALLQEYTQQLYQDQIESWEYAYLDSWQMRDLLTQAGTPQSDDGCPIGVQPDVGKAMQLLKDGVVTPTIKPFTNPGSLGAAHVCVDNYLADPSGFDPTTDCPNSYQPLAKRMDLDGDGRADLIAWTRQHQWWIDLSGTPSPNSDDGFGAWDLTLTPPSVSTAASGPSRLFPVVADYDADGRADLALYNTDTGVLQIKRTTDALLETGTFGVWDATRDYSADPQWQAQSRPFVGDFNGPYAADYVIHGPDANGAYHAGRAVDFGLVTPDGQWLLDYGQGTLDSYGAFDQALTVLSPAQLQQAPGWAYVPLPHVNTFGVPEPPLDVAYLVPDGFADSQTLYYVGPPFQYDGVAAVTPADLTPIEGLVPLGAHQLIPAQYDASPTAQSVLGCRAPKAPWSLWDWTAFAWQPLQPTQGLGNADCHAIPADYDGDGHDDRAVLCHHGEWRIAYTADDYPLDPQDGLRHIPLGLAGPALPGQIYPGGVALDTIDAIYSQYHYNCPPDASAEGGPASGGGEPCTLFTLTPAPIGPHFADCLATWAHHPTACLQY